MRYVLALILALAVALTLTPATHAAPEAAPTAQWVYGYGVTTYTAPVAVGYYAVAAPVVAPVAYSYTVYPTSYVSTWSGFRPWRARAWWRW